MCMAISDRGYRCVMITGSNVCRIEAAISSRRLRSCQLELIKKVTTRPTCRLLFSSPLCSPPKAQLQLRQQLSLGRVPHFRRLSALAPEAQKHMPILMSDLVSPWRNHRLKDVLIAERRGSVVRTDVEHRAADLYLSTQPAFENNSGRHSPPSLRISNLDEDMMEYSRVYLVYVYEQLGPRQYHSSLAPLLAPKARSKKFRGPTDMTAISV
jgi:hypothetical protein